MLSRFSPFLRSLTVRLVTTVSLVSWAIQPSLSQTDVPELPEEPWAHDWPSRIEPLPPAPQYDSLVHWACHPFKNDQLLAPKGGLRLNAAVELEADVFFLHPTMHMEGPEWNADVFDEAMNKEVDAWPIKHQASAFAHVGRVFAPRYRQAHIRIFSLGDSLSYEAAAVAYGDLRKAFETYLAQWNEGRPIILAGHSQGSYHGRTLLQEFFDGKPLANQLVAAYLPGMDMYSSDFQELEGCQSDSDVGCICSWMTYANGFVPDWVNKHAEPTPIMAIHPVIWSTAPGMTNNRKAHLGAVKASFRNSKRGLITGALNDLGLLWIDKPHVLGGRWLHQDNWHVGDVNLFWHNVAANVKKRNEAWHGAMLDKGPNLAP